MVLPGFCLLFLGFFGCSGALTQIECLLFSVCICIVIENLGNRFVGLVFVDFRSDFDISNDFCRIFRFISIENSE